MRLDLLVFADMANVDRAGKFNIVGEFNLVFSQQLPTQPMAMSMVVRLVAEAPEGPDHQVAIAIVDEDGLQLARTPDVPMRFGAPVPGTTADLRAQIVLGMLGVSFSKFAPYSFQVLVDGRFVGERELYVAQAQPAS